MKWTLLIYIFALFVLFTPNVMFRTPIKNNILVSCIHSLVFSLFLYLTYNFIDVNIENLESKEEESTLEKIIGKILSKFKKKQKKYSVHNIVYEMHPNENEFYDITYSGKNAITIALAAAGKLKSSQ